MERKKQAEPSIADVAALAGVSYMTVSRVINDAKTVSPERTERVRQAIEQLGYRPNAAARALRTGRSHTIGIVWLGSSLPASATYLVSVERAAREAGFGVNIVSLDGLDPVSVGRTVDDMLSRSVDGIVMVAPRGLAAELPGQRTLDVPVVTIWGPCGIGVPVTAYDHVAAAAQGTRHLLDLGHPTVHHVAGPADWTGCALRVVGWRSALEAAGRPAPEPILGDCLPEGGYRAGLELLTDPAVSAVFLTNDLMALGFAAAARELGRRIPEDVSIVGYDDQSGSEMFNPPLTTLSQDFAVVGRRAFDLIRRLIETGETGDHPPLLVPELVIRESTAVYRPR